MVFNLIYGTESLADSRRISIIVESEWKKIWKTTKNGNEKNANITTYNGTY